MQKYAYTHSQGTLGAANFQKWELFPTQRAVLESMCLAYGNNRLITYVSVFHIELNDNYGFKLRLITIQLQNTDKLGQISWVHGRDQISLEQMQGKFTDQLIPQGIHTAKISARFCTRLFTNVSLSVNILSSLDFVSNDCWCSLLAVSI